MNKTEENAEPATIEQITKSMASRMPWDVGRKVLHALDLPRGQGWERTLQKLSAQHSPTDQSLAAARNALRGHILCGEKMVRLYKVERAEIDRVANALHTPRGIADDGHRKSYPLVLTEAEAADVDEHGPRIVEIGKSEHGIEAVFESIRSVTYRTELQPGDLSPAAQEALQGYDEIIGVKRAKFHAMDVIHLPKNGNLVELRVDAPRGTPRSAGYDALARVASALGDIAGRPMVGAPVNLFPLIRSIYDASGEGTVVELAFGTTTASTKHERMRRQHLDLRNEAYHVGGKNALVSPIEPYRLSVKWDVAIASEVKSRPELGLFAGTAGQQSMLHEAIIRNCTGLRDYNYVQSRVAHFLSLIAKT